MNELGQGDRGGTVDRVQEPESRLKEKGVLLQHGVVGCLEQCIDLCIRQFPLLYEVE